MDTLECPGPRGALCGLFFCGNCSVTPRLSRRPPSCSSRVMEAPCASSSTGCPLLLQVQSGEVVRQRAQTPPTSDTAQLFVTLARTTPTSAVVTWRILSRLSGDRAREVCPTQTTETWHALRQELGWSSVHEAPNLGGRSVSVAERLGWRRRIMPLTVGSGWGGWEGGGAETVFCVRRERFKFSARPAPSEQSPRTACRPFWR